MWLPRREQMHDPLHLLRIADSRVDEAILPHLPRVPRVRTITMRRFVEDAKRRDEPAASTSAIEQPVAQPKTV